MRTIACLSQKGGVGKSTLARLIAVAQAKRGSRVKIADFNLKQKTCVKWAATRSKAGHKPEIAAEPFSSVKVALSQSAYDLMVFDTRPDSDTESLAIAQVSDLVILPTGVTIDDLEPQVNLAHELKMKGIHSGRIRFVITNPPNSSKIIEEVSDFITARGFITLSSNVPFRITYQQALDSGLALNELDTGFFIRRLGSLNKRADALAMEILDVLLQLKVNA